MTEPEGATEGSTGGGEDAPGVRRAWGWALHLRGGGTTPWMSWTDNGPAGGRYLPGAQQLELLRRLNLAGSPSPALVERVLSASAPGRGRPDLLLLGSVERPRFGPPPVDPADLDEDELLRFAAGLLADDLVARGATRAGAPRPSPGWVRPWRRRSRLRGDPALVVPLRAELVRQGRPPGGRAPTVLVVGTDHATMLSDAWTHRCFGQGGPGWRRWLDGQVRRDRLPPRADLLQLARQARRRHPRGRVVVVLDPAAAPRLLRAPRLSTRPLVVSADAADLARRVSAALGLLVLPPERERLLRRVLRPRLAQEPGAPAGLPEEHHAWAHRWATRMRDDLLRAGYAVHGDPDALLPRRQHAAEPSRAATLALSLRLLLEADGSRERGTGRGSDDETGPGGLHSEGQVRTR